LNKGNFSTGQPIFNQLLSLIPRTTVAVIGHNLKANRYCKTFDTYEHLVTMLYAVLNGCMSLREVTTGLLAWENRIGHLGIRFHPRRSTISDANSRRSEEVFGEIYQALLRKYQPFLSDSRKKTGNKKVYIFDSTTISLFQEILKGSGMSNANGRRKGGIKVHTLLDSDLDVPTMIRYSSGAANDAQFLKLVALPSGSVVVFDRGYRDYKTYNKFTEQKITWVSRLHPHSVFKVVERREVSDGNKQAGVRFDHEIVLGHNHDKDAIKVFARMVKYRDPVSGKIFEFITNNLKVSPLRIAQYYERRWQIETFFKRIKQNYSLQYFLGDNENAIKIQIWCALIADILLKVIKKQTNCSLSFSNLSSLIRLHIMTYMKLKDFLKAPEKSLIAKLKHKKIWRQSATLFSG
jgi:IS4 transposase